MPSLGKKLAASLVAIAGGGGKDAVEVDGVDEGPMAAASVVDAATDAEACVVDLEGVAVVPASLVSCGALAGVASS